MSGPSAARVLPPGSHDEAAALPHRARRETDAPLEQLWGADGLLPGLSLEITRLGPLLDEAQMALGDLKLGRTQKNWATFEASAHRLAALADHAARTITRLRPRETSKLATEE